VRIIIILRRSEYIAVDSSKILKKSLSSTSSESVSNPVPPLVKREADSPLSQKQKEETPGGR